MTFITADLYDTRANELASLSLQMRNFGGMEQFSGAIRTVQCFEDNALVKEVLSQKGDGSVLVVDGGGSLRTALVGDVMAGMAAENGWAGLVIHGVVRDSTALAGLPLGIKAMGTNPCKSTKAGTGRHGCVLRFGGVTFVPGAFLYADADGVVVENPSVHHSLGTVQSQEAQESRNEGEERFIEGLTVRSQVMGDSFVATAFSANAGTDGELLQRQVTENVWGALWARPGLDHRSRSLLTLAALTVLRAHDELRGHVRGALRNGLTRTEIVEAVAHVGGYAGAPAALSAMGVVKDVLNQELGPLQSPEDYAQDF
ncbi:ribonuclease E activity regulator RraA [bacterium RCC_150]